MSKRPKYNKSRRDLFCYGCSNSNDDGGFPGEPEFSPINFSPCHMCLRSVDVQERIEVGEPLLSTKFPNGTSPIALPFDAYCPADMWDLHRKMLDEAVEEAVQRDVREQIEKLKRQYGAR